MTPNGPATRTRASCAKESLARARTAISPLACALHPPLDDSTDKAQRGGAGNILAEGKKPTNVRTDEEYVPEPNMRVAHQEEFHTGVCYPCIARESG